MESVAGHHTSNILCNMTDDGFKNNFNKTLIWNAVAELLNYNTGKFLAFKTNILT